MLGKTEADALFKGEFVILYGANKIIIVSNKNLDLPDGVSNYPLIHIQLEVEDIAELKKKKNNRALVYHGSSGEIFVGRVEWFPNLAKSEDIDREPTGSSVYG